LILVSIVAMSVIGCTSAQPVDPCAGCPFTERPVPVWTPPDFPPLPALPVLEAPLWTADQILADWEGYYEALARDETAILTALEVARRWYEDIRSAAPVEPDGTS
jgi:hypothetical protein